MTHTDYLIFDVETDGFDYTKILCVAVIYEGRTDLFTNIEDLANWVDYNTSAYTYWVGHNSCGFDYWALRDLAPKACPDRTKVLDTSVLSKLVDYKKFNTHSLAEIGEFLGKPKAEYTGGFEKYSREMGEYCLRDAQVCEAIFNYVRIMVDVHGTASKVEHEMSLISAEMQRNGFRFNKRRAEVLLEEVKQDMTLLEDELQTAFPPRLVEDRRIQWRITKAGVPHAACLKAQAAAPKWEIEGDELVLYKLKEFSPGSPKDRIDVLWDAGWKPYDKTKGHMAFERERRSR